jgi:hypothetical protein
MGYMTRGKNKNKGFAGRPKGAGNNKSMVVKLALNRMNFDVLEEYINAYRELEDPKDKIVALNELMKYVHPKLKEVDYIELRKQEIEEELLKLEGVNLEASTEELLKEIEDQDVIEAEDNIKV